jgi:hypothetical protein
MKKLIFLLLLVNTWLASGQQDYRFSFPSPEIRVDTVRPLSAYRLSIIKPLNVTGSLSVKGTRLPSMFMLECVDSINSHRFALTKNGYLISGTHHNPATSVDGLVMMGRGNTLFGADAVTIGKQVVNEADTTMALGYYYTVPETKHNMTIIGYGNNRIEMAADSGRFVGNWKLGGGGSYTLPAATSATLGGVKSGSRVTIATDGTISANVQAWTDITGKPAFSTVAISGSYTDLSSKPTIPAEYILPAATSSVLGGVKIGTGLTINSGVLSNAAEIYHGYAAGDPIGVWLDGKTIYKKSSYGKRTGGTTGPTSISVGIDLPSNATIIKMDYSVQKDDTYYNSNYYVSETDYLIIRATISSVRAELVHGSESALYCTVYYVLD